MSADGNDSRAIKRIRQACLNCRRKKVRCSGGRPCCALCKRTSQTCRYANASWYHVRDGPEQEPYDRRSGSVLSEPPVMHSEEMIWRLDGLESRLSGLEKTMHTLVTAINESRQSTTTETPRPMRTGSPPSSSGAATPSGTRIEAPLTPQKIGAAADIYFHYCHNQPYSLFHEASFRRQLQSNQVPNCLIYAFVATAERYFSSPKDKTARVVSSYAAKAWHSITLPWNSDDGRVVLPIVQTMLLLSVIDYTDSKCSPAWIKLGMAIRLAQNIGLTAEPDPQLSPIEREERRRIFWSLYILDRLISCGRHRSPTILDDDCKVHLPSSESAFKAGVEQQTATLELLTGDRPPPTALETSSHFALVVLMTCTLSRVTKYALQEDKYLGHGIPWSVGSQYAAVDSMLLQLESNFRLSESLTELISEQCTVNGVLDQQTAGLLVFARVIFHLCHCLLHHPFLLQQRLVKLHKKGPASFLTRSRRTCQHHTEMLSTTIQDANGIGCLTLTSFYSYCHLVAGSIHALFSLEGNGNGDNKALLLYKDSLDKLKQLARYWKLADVMVAKLERFQQSLAGATLSPFELNSEGRCPPDVKALWESVDYWPVSTVTSSNEQQEEHENSTILRSTAAIDLDFSFFDFPQWSEVDPTLVDLDDAEASFDSLHQFDHPEPLLGMASPEGW